MISAYDLYKQLDLHTVVTGKHVWKQLDLLMYFLKRTASLGQPKKY